MPIYRYTCPKCGKEEKFLHRINEKLEFHCPECKIKMEKTIPSKVGIKFNQGGFYATDTKKQR